MPHRDSVRRLFSLALIALCAFLALPIAVDAAIESNGPNATAVCSVRLAIGSFAEPNPNFGIIEPTIETLETAFPGSLCVARMNTADLEEAVRIGSVDLFLSSAGLYRRVLHTGVRDIASVIGPHITNPNEAEGSVFIALKNRTDLQSISSMRGRNLAANLKNGFTGYLTGMLEIADQGYDPEGFFRSTQFLGHDQTLVLDALVSGKADIGIVRACTFEDMIEQNPRYKGRFKVLAEKTHPGFKCRHSSELYPSWVLGVTKRIAPEDAARAASAVLAMPSAIGGLKWLIATDFTQVDRLYRTLRIGPYDFLKEWSFTRFWEEHKTSIVSAFLLVLGLLLHGWRSETLVERRTRELQEAWTAERAAEKEAEKLREHMQNLQRAGVVGQISSLIAHELSQPVGAVRLYSHGLLRSLEDRAAPSEASQTEAKEIARIASTVSRIDEQAERAQEILDRVRSYARTKTQDRKAIVLQNLIATAVKHFRITSRGGVATIEVDAPAENPLLVFANPLELELVLANLLKNAADALRTVPESERPSPPLIRIAIREADARVRLEVSDNGPFVSDDDLERLSAPMNSSKPNGLGLGLAICRTIVENHGGAISFARGDGGLGIRVTVELPVAKIDETKNSLPTEKNDHVCQHPNFRAPTHTHR